MGYITCEVATAYPAIFSPKPTAKNSTRTKYQFTGLMTAQTWASPEMKVIRDAVLEAAINKFGQDAPNKLRDGKLNSPFKKLTESDGFPPEYIMAFKASSNDQPGAVYAWAGSNGKPAPITDAKEIYAGMFARVSVNVYAYDNESKGVALGFNNIQKLRDSEIRFDGRKTAENEFGVTQDKPVDMPDTSGAATGEGTKGGAGDFADLWG